MQLEVYNRRHLTNPTYLFASLPRLCDMGTVDKPKLDGQADSAKAASSSIQTATMFTAETAEFAENDISTQ